MNAFLLLICLVAVTVNAINLERREVSVESVVVRDFDPDRNIVRQLEAHFHPSVDAPEQVAVVGSGFSARNVGDGNFDANLDIAGFHMRTPGVNGGGDDFSLYFGYLDADADYNANTGVGSVTASLAEAISAFYNIYVWENRDGVPGFQYTLTENHFGGCRAGETFDCFRTVQEGDEYQYSLKAAKWNPIQITQYDCSDDENAVNGTDCTVTTFTASTVDGVVIFDMHIASQPVLLGDVDLDPNHAKLDVSINWDWSDYTDCDSCSLALIGATAGKLTNGNLEVQNSGDGTTRQTATFSTGDYEASFEWENSAAIEGVASTVYFSAISRQDLDGYTCGGDGVPCLSVGHLVNFFLQTAANIFSGFGWETTFLIFSWDDVQPTTVFWDPSIGGGPVGGYDFSDVSNGAAAIAITNMLLVVIAYIM